MSRELDEDFPLAKKFVYLNAAAIGACPASTFKVVRSYVKDRCRWLSGEGGWKESLNRWLDKVKESKRLFARFIGAGEHEVAYVPNTTVGINTVFSMLPLKPGQNIVTTDLSYPMGAAVCLKQRERGIEVRFVRSRNGEVRIEDFEKTIDDNTAAVLVDQAAWFNGFLYDLKAIAQVAHEHGALLVVDAIQSVGGMSLDVKRDEVDFLAVSTYKWLLGGPYTQSAGYLYIDEEHIEEFQPPFVGDNTIEEEQFKVNMYERFDLYDLKCRKGIGRFQIYPRYEIAYAAVENSMKVLLNHGLERVERKIKKLATILVDNFLEEGFKLQTPEEEGKRLFVNVRVRNNRELEEKLYAHRIIVSARVGGLRVSPHFYNTEEDIEAFLDKFKEFAEPS